MSLYRELKDRKVIRVAAVYTLVVETTHINYPYLTRVGLSQSEDVTILETFRMMEVDGRAELHHEMTVTDPWGLTEPFTANGHWAWVLGEEVAQFDCGY